jgi:hypothetical protein
MANVDNKVKTLKVESIDEAQADHKKVSIVLSAS